MMYKKEPHMKPYTIRYAARNYIVFLGVLVVFIALALFPGKSSSASQKHDDWANMLADAIDGAKHPELISDDDAYYMLFLTHSVPPGAAQEDLNRQQNLIRQTKVTGDESGFVAMTLNDFRVQYEQLVADYNAKATERQRTTGLGYDPTEFVKSRQALVLATHHKLSTGLTAVSLANFDRRVQSFKSHLKISR
jgi:hypothetical protein